MLALGVLTLITELLRQPFPLRLAYVPIPMIFLSQPPFAFLAHECHHITAGRENGSILHILLAIVYSPIWSYINSHSDQPSASRDATGFILLPSLYSPAALCPEHSPSCLLPIQILVSFQTWLTFPWFSSTVFQSMLIVLPALLEHSLCYHEMLLFSIKMKLASPRLSEEGKRAGGKEYPVTRPDWMPENPFLIGVALELLSLQSGWTFL